MNGSALFLFPASTVRGRRGKGRFRKEGDRAGFTLLELIVVLVILGMATTFAVVEVGRRKDRTEFLSEVRRIAVTLKNARQGAIMDRMEYSFHTDLDVEGRPYYWIEKEGRPEGSPRSLPDGYEISDTVVAFFPRGYSTGGEIVLRNGKGRESRVTVDPILGRVTIGP